MSKTEKKPEKAASKEKVAEEKPGELGEAKINKYGFLHFKKKWREGLGWPLDKDLPVAVSKNQDGSVTVRRP